jgi:hypothetical protein
VLIKFNKLNSLLTDWVRIYLLAFDFIILNCL